MTKQTDFIKVNHVRKYLRTKGAYAVSPRTMTKLNIIVEELLDNAYDRSLKNRRSTVFSRDL